MKTTKTSSILLAAFLIGCLLASTIPAQDAAPVAPTQSGNPADRTEDETAVQQTIQRFTRAFENGDASAAASLLSSGAELVADDAPSVVGRAANQAAFTNHFANHPRVSIENVSDSTRFPSHDTSVVEGLIRVVSKDSGTENDRYQIRLVREDGKWLLSRIHQWPHEQAALLDLEWLIGTWSSQQDNAEVNTTYEWFGNKAFIRAHFTIRENDKSYTGMQMIGVDPETGMLRTWIFESEAGFGEGFAIQDGTQWIFESATMLASNDVLHATNVLVRIDGNKFTWQPLDLSINDQQFGNLPPVKVTRVK